MKKKIVLILLMMSIAHVGFAAIVIHKTGGWRGTMDTNSAKASGQYWVFEDTEDFVLLNVPIKYMTNGSPQWKVIEMSTISKDAVEAILFSGKKTIKKNRMLARFDTARRILQRSTANIKALINRLNTVSINIATTTTTASLKSINIPF